MIQKSDTCIFMLFKKILIKCFSAYHQDANTFNKSSLTDDWNQMSQSSVLIQTLETVCFYELQKWFQVQTFCGKFKSKLSIDEAIKDEAFPLNRKQSLHI